MSIQWGELWRTNENALIEHSQYGALIIRFPRHHVVNFYYAADKDELDVAQPIITMFRTSLQAQEDYSAKWAPFLHECSYTNWNGDTISFDDMVAMFCSRPSSQQERLNWVALEMLHLEAPAIIDSMEEAACLYEDASDWKENVVRRMLQQTDVVDPDAEGLAEYVDEQLTFGASVHTHIKLAGGAFCIVSSYNGHLGKGARIDYADHAGSNPHVSRMVCVERAKDPTADDKRTITVTYVDEFGEPLPDGPPWSKPIVYLVG